MARQLTLALPKGGELTPTAMILDPKIPYEKWEHIGERLRELNINSRWWLGDWFNHGERHLGEKHAQAIQETTFDRETLRNYAYVADRIPPERRRGEEFVTWSHHRVVASMPPKQADLWLEKCAAERWSVKELKREIKRSKRDPDTPDEKEDEEIIHAYTVSMESPLVPGASVKHGKITYYILADLGVQKIGDDKGTESDQRILVAAHGTEHFQPESITPLAVAEWLSEKLSKELGV